ncbi:hypothetical protein [Microbaculum marinum]|uniref:Uncharacterized protein n=1 Tax=Microbaculum marinum TaxID=1764581 RepID=A0AAW9RQR3_9HYPH
MIEPTPTLRSLDAALMRACILIDLAVIRLNLASLLDQLDAKAEELRSLSQ